MVVLAVGLAAAGAVLVWLGLRQRTGALPRNVLAGLRTTATLASDEAWYAAHHATWPHIVAAGVPPLVGNGEPSVGWRRSGAAGRDRSPTCRARGSTGPASSGADVAPDDARRPSVDTATPTRTP